MMMMMMLKMMALLRAKKARLAANRKCPYLDTINRGVLDFDFEKLCSVSLSRINCYVCLVCGKYFQVRIQDSRFTPGQLQCSGSRKQHSCLHPLHRDWPQSVSQLGDPEVLLSTRQLRDH